MPRPTGARRLWLAAPVALALLAGGAARAEIYRWTDAQGDVHFTQSLDQVPPAQRPAARARARDATPDRVQRYAAPHRARVATRTRRQSLDIPFERHGTLMKVDALLNGAVTAPFYIDTGASSVSIPYAIAQQLGIRIDADTPTVLVQTANGVVASPVVKIDSVALGGATVENLDATISSTMRVGLLGGSFFNNFVYQVDAAEGVIHLTPNQSVRGGLDPGAWRQRFRDAREPIGRLEDYLEQTHLTDPMRRAELERRLSELHEALATLELEANRAGVPQAWRQ